MSDGTGIEWTDATANVINGCSLASPGCTNCYAMRLAGTRLKHHPTREGLTIDTKAGPVWTGAVRFHEPALQQVLRWQRPRMIFWNAHGDMFHPNVPDEWIDRCFAVMAMTPHHTHQVLTKRSARMREYMSKSCGRIADTIIRIRRDRGDNGVVVPLPHVPIGTAWWPLPNVWLGISAEDQTRADERIPDLLATPAAVRWISAEPLLGPINLRQVARDADGYYNTLTSSCGANLDWVVVGGESGPGARPMHPDGARSLRDQCANAGVAFLFKQWGEWAPGDAFCLISDGPITDRDGSVRDWMHRYVVCGDRADRLTAHSFTGHATDLVYRVGKHRAGRLLDGVTHDGYPGRIVA